MGRRRAVPVVGADDRYVGMAFLDDMLAVDPDRWATTTVEAVMRADSPVGRPEWTIGKALTAMLAADVEHLPVVDDDGTVRGMAGAVDILDLDDLLHRLDPRGDGH